MNCGACRELLFDHLDGELSGEAAREVAGHLERCGGCRRELDALRDSQEWLARWQEPGAPPDFEQRLARRIARSEARPARLRTLIAWAAAAAACAAAGSLAFGMGQGTARRMASAGEGRGAKLPFALDATVEGMGQR